MGCVSTGRVKQHQRGDLFIAHRLALLRRGIPYYRMSPLSQKQDFFLLQIGLHLALLRVLNGYLGYIYSPNITYGEKCFSGCL